MPRCTDTMFEKEGGMVTDSYRCQLEEGHADLPPDAEGYSEKHYHKVWGSGWEKRWSRPRKAIECGHSYCTATPKAGELYKCPYCGGPVCWPCAVTTGTLYDDGLCERLRKIEEDLIGSLSVPSETGPVHHKNSSQQ